METEPESIIVDENYKIKPSHIDTADYFYRTFGQCESEDVARHIVMFCQEKGKWTKFSKKEILRFYNRINKDHPLERFHFYFLVDPQPLSKIEAGKDPIRVGGGWIIEKNGEYFITKEFVERCHERHPKKVIE